MVTLESGGRVRRVGGDLRLAALAIVGAIGLSGCATVPKQVAELSSQMGGQLEAIHSSYSALIHQRYDDLRAQRLDYFEHQWEPAFIAKWVQNGHLTDLAAGRLVWSKEKHNFIVPAPGQGQAELLESVNDWAKSAIAQLDKKRNSLIDPLNQDEQSLNAAVDDEFSRLDRANAAITAHLNSLLKVQNAQDQALAELRVKGFKEQVNNLVQQASIKAQQGLEQIEKADAAVASAKAGIEKK